MSKLDIHINLGTFPDSENTRSKAVHTEVEEVSEFLLRGGITYAVILYPRDGYSLLEEVAHNSPGVKIYGLQVVMGQDRSSPSCIETISLDVLQPNKPLCKGIKLASHRGWWVEEGMVRSGLNYGESRRITTLLKKLPGNSLVSMHLQGDPINNSGSVPMMVAKYASKFPTLKFIMNHAGDYGPESQTGKNKKHIYLTKTGNKLSGYASFRHAHSRALIRSCVEYANNTYNLWLDSSCYMRHKAELFRETDKWALGSDYPFNASKNLFLLEERRFEAIIGEGSVSRASEKTERWIESDWKDLYREHVRALQLEDNVQDVVRRITQ